MADHPSRYNTLETAAWDRGDQVWLKTEDLDPIEGDHRSQDRSGISKQDILNLAAEIREREELKPVGMRPKVTVGEHPWRCR